MDLAGEEMLATEQNGAEKSQGREISRAGRKCYGTVLPQPLPGSKPSIISCIVLMPSVHPPALRPT